MTDKTPLQPEVLGETTTADLAVGPRDIYEKIYFSKSEALIDEWRRQCDQDRKMRGRFATWVFILASGQIILMFALIALVGFEFFKFPGYIVEVTIPSMLSEIFGLAYLVVRYLFTKTPPPFNADQSGS